MVLSKMIQHRTRHEKKTKNRSPSTDLPDGVGRLHGIELHAPVDVGVGGVAVAQVDLEEAGDATLDVGAPDGLPLLEGDGVNDAFVPAARRLVG